MSRPSDNNPAPAEDEPPEPQAERRPVPVLLVGLLVALLYWGEVYVVSSGGDLSGKTGSFPSSVYYPFTTYAQVEAANPVGEDDWWKINGEIVFAQCAACHQPTGLGNRSMNFPPLAGSEWVQAEGPHRIIRIVLHGLSGPIAVKNEQYNNSMASLGSLTDTQIAAVVTWIRKQDQWGHNASVVKPEQVQAIREKEAKREAPWTASELLAIPDKD